MTPLFVSTAEEISRRAHLGQIDKAGRVHIDHLVRVAASLSDDPYAAAVGWTHDVLNLSDWSATELVHAGLPSSVVDAVEALTYVRNEARHVFYARVRANPLALRTKLTCIADNLDPARLRRLDRASQDRLTAKYADALRFLYPEGDSF